MNKKVVSVLMAGALCSTMLVGCGGKKAATNNSGNAGNKAATTKKTELKYDGEIKVWVADNAVDFTKDEIQKFQDKNSGLKNAKFTVEPVGEGDAASNMITDVEAGADVFTFAQDQTARLVSAGALEEVEANNAAQLKKDNDEGAVKAGTVGKKMYAYPITADNTYFLYYDKSVVTDPSDLDKILSDCKAANKKFYMAVDNGWYQTAFFFGAGCKLTYDTDDKGNFTKCNIDYASDKGVAALKAMATMAGSGAWANGSDASKATDVAAIVDGTWDSATVKQLFGDNYACAKLPQFTGGDGKKYQMSGFSGYKLLGVKPQEDADKLAVCDALAAYLSSGDVQLDRFKALGWGPSNLEARKDDAVTKDAAMMAVFEQMKLDQTQGQYPGDYWTTAEGLGGDIVQGNITASTSDDDLMKTLQTFQDTCKSYAK